MQQMLIDFGDLKSLLKTHYGDFDDITWGSEAMRVLTARAKEKNRK